MPSLEFGLSSPALLVVPVLLLAFLAAFLSYRRTLPPVSRPLRIVLTVLRGTALGLLALLLFEPVVRAVYVSSEPPVLAVLIDNSRSMRLHDAGGRRDSVLRHALSRIPDMLPPGTRLAAYTFGAGVSEPQEVLPESLRLDEPSTNIDRALRAAGEQAGRVRAVLLLTDGNATAGPNPLYAAEELRLPVYTIGIGDSTEQRDLVIIAVSSNRVMLAGSSVPVEVRIKSAGYSGERVTVMLTDGSRELARTDLSLRAGVSEYSVPLTFTPRGEGTQLFTARVSPLPGELTTENNRRSFPAVVLKERLSIVLLGGAPGPDLAIMRQTLHEDPNADVQVFTQRPDGGFFEGELRPATLDSCDVLILLGYPATTSPDETVRRLAETIRRRRLPLLLMTARSLDQNRLQQLGDLLPFTTGVVNPTEQTVFAVPVESQRDHPLLATDSSGSSWAALPPLFRTSTSYQAKPGTRVLATARLQSVRLPDPLIIARSSGAPRAVVILGYGLWRWRLMTQGNPEISGFYAAFLSTTIRWLTTRDDTRPVRIAPLQAIGRPLEAVEFEGQVRDGAARPLDNALVTVTVDGKEFSGGITLAAAGNGRYTGAFIPLPAGQYTYRGRAMIGETSVGSDSGRFAIDSVDLETYETRMVAQNLRLIAARTGGAFFAPDDLAPLGNALRAQPSFVPVETRTASTVEFRHWPWLLALVVLVLAVEWFLRKRSGML